MSFNEMRDYGRVLIGDCVFGNSICLNQDLQDKRQLLIGSCGRAKRQLKSKTGVSSEFSSEVSSSL